MCIELHNRYNSIMEFQCHWDLHNDGFETVFVEKGRINVDFGREKF
jgi:hypothetical protein